MLVGHIRTAELNFEDLCLIVAHRKDRIPRLSFQRVLDHPLGQPKTGVAPPGVLFRLKAGYVLGRIGLDIVDRIVRQHIV